MKKKINKDGIISKISSYIKCNYKKVLLYVILLIIAMLMGVGIDVVVRPNENGEFILDASFSMHLSPTQQPAIVENENGEEVITEDIVTIEAIDGNQLAEECPVGEECGLGKYIYAPTESFTVFKDYTLGNCYDVDGYYGSQCWDLASVFWMNYTENGRLLSTCGTGAAKGAWNCKEQNAGNDFELVYNAVDVQAGDWIIFGSGKFGHVGMALGSYNNGYITLLGTNQGGQSCAGGGSATNIINISLNSFVGAFRPKSYIKPAPAPEPIPVSGCEIWHVKKGDTMSRIMLECEGTVVYGEAMNNYAKSWYSMIVKPGQSVYEGWNSKSGVGLYANDDIEHRIGN